MPGASFHRVCRRSSWSFRARSMDLTDLRLSRVRQFGFGSPGTLP